MKTRTMILCALFAALTAIGAFFKIAFALAAISLQFLFTAMAGVLLGAAGVYEPFVRWAGAGASVPLTGFGSLLAGGVRKAVAERGVLGAFTGGFTAGAAGICAAIFFGLLAAMLFRSKDKQ